MNELEFRRKKASTRHKLPLCQVCGHEFKYRVKRNWVVKILMFWSPVKRYFCEECAESYYINKPKYAK